MTNVSYVREQPGWLYRLISTPDDFTFTLLRLVAGVVFFAHGSGKMLGWFGGSGFHGTMQFFTQEMGIPSVLAFLVICSEFFGSIGLIVGCLARIASTGIIGIMIGAVLLSEGRNGFFMNWYGDKKGEGYEYHLLAIALCLAVLIKGAGAYSIDHALSRRREQGKPASNAG